jgi:hypothetical protein
MFGNKNQNKVEYKSVIVYDTKHTVSFMFGDPVGKKINQLGKQGWILDSDELIQKGGMFSASKRRLTFHKGGEPVSIINNTSGSIADELVKLNSLKDEGIISQKEFETQKNKLLDN